MFQKQTFRSTNTGFGGFGQQQATGTAVVKYNPVAGTDVVVESGNTTDVYVNIHCITSMEEYESKSLEELRLEDYVAKRKGPSGVFGTNSVGATANTSTTGGHLGSTTSRPTRLFGHEKIKIYGNTFIFGYRRPTGTAVCSYRPGQSEYLVEHFGEVKLYMRLTINCITSMKEYESKSLEELRLEDYVAGRKGPTGVFGTNIPAFGQPVTMSAPSLFGSSISSTPAFGQTSTGLFAATTTQAPAFGTNTSTFGFGANTQNQTGGFFNNKPATSGFGTTPSTGFGGFGAGLFAKTNTTAPTFGTTTPELQERGKKIKMLQTKTENLIRESQQLKKRQGIDSEVLQKYKSEISKVQKHVKILTHQNALGPGEQLGLQQWKVDALREQGTGNGNTAKDLQQGEEDSLREQGVGNGNTAEDLQQRKGNALREQGARNGNTVEDLQQEEEDSLREQGSENGNTVEELQQGEEDSLREQGAGNGNTAEDLQQRERNALREQGARNGNTMENLQQEEEDSLREQGAGNGNTIEELQQGEEDSLREQGAGNGNTAEDLQQREGNALREQGARNGNTVEDLQQEEEDSLREQGSGNGNTVEELQQGEEDSLREQGAGNGNTAEDLQIKKAEKPEDTDIMLWEKKIKLAEEDAQKALERAEKAEKKLEELQQRQSIVAEDRKPGKPNPMSKINYFETEGEKKEIKIEPAPLQEPTPTSRPPSPPVLPPPPLPAPPAVFQSSPAEDMAVTLANKSANLKKTKQNGRVAIEAIVDQMKGLKFQLKSTDQNILEKPKNDQPVAVKNMIQIVVTLTDKKNIKKLATEQEE